MDTLSAPPTPPAAYGAAGAAAPAHDPKARSALQSIHTPVDADVVVLRYSDLISGADLSSEIERAFGYDGLGLLAVSGVPQLAERRAALLPLAHAFARLPDAAKAKYESADTFYQVGWSHGREKLQGHPDYSKGSFYANPLHNAPFTDPQHIRDYPSFAAPNIWPAEELPALEPAFMAAGSLMVEVGRLVAAQCDAYVRRRCATYPAARLADVVATSRVCKGRLLHYFARDAPEAAAEAAPSAASRTPTAELAEEDAFSDWCGWHNDHGSLTALMPAMFLSDGGASSGPVEVACPDAAAGLYIRSRRGELVRPRVPADCLAFQIGETAQIHSGGLLQATPHAVRGASAAGVSRETFAVFMEPEWLYPMTVPDGLDPAATQSTAAASLLPAGVRPLHARWGTPGCPFTTCNFGDFTRMTFEANH